MFVGEERLRDEPLKTFAWEATSDTQAGYLVATQLWSQNDSAFSIKNSLSPLKLEVENLLVDSLVTFVYYIFYILRTVSFFLGPSSKTHDTRK